MGIVRRVAIATMVWPAIGLSGCAMTPMGPMVQVSPGPHKSFEVFQQDQTYCKQYSTQQVAGQAEAANNQAIGGAILATALGAATGAAIGGGNGAAIGAASAAGLGAGVGADASTNAQGGIQYQYDNAFGQCMYSKGHMVAGFGPPIDDTQRVAQGPNPLVRAVQAELIRLRYLAGGADGVFGAKTGGAIRSYERASSLPVDGTASQRLLAKLQSTPTSMAAASPGDSSGWVAPATASAAPPAQQSAGWVSPASPTPPPAQQAGGWVTPVGAPQ